MNVFCYESAISSHMKVSESFLSPIKKHTLDNVSIWLTSYG